MDWTILDERLKDLGEQYRVLVSPKDAAALGAGAVVMFLIQGPEEGKMFADNARAVAEAASEAHQVGLPLIVECTLWGSRMTDRKDPDLLAFGCRMAAELGADAVKTEYTGDPGTMAEVIEGCPVPVLTLGGAKGTSEEAVVEAARGAIEGGAKGIIFGRNVWQADDPMRMSASLREVVHGVPIPASR
jgi:DhnA family fructose-bisphosphate aldolase class Ia